MRGPRGGGIVGGGGVVGREAGRFGRRSLGRRRRAGGSCGRRTGLISG